MLPLFSITFEIVTPESAESGEAEETGFIVESVRLREAVDEFHRTRTNQVDGVEALEDSGRWFTVVNGPEFETGAQESRSIHPAGNITPASYRRLGRLLGIKGRA